MVRITLSGRDIPLIVVYPHSESFDNGLATHLDKLTGGLCGNWKKNNPNPNTDQVRECKLYYKDRMEDKCINATDDPRINEEFKTYWRYFRLFCIRSL